MNYRHAYHAGNFADVIKHVAVVSVLLHLRKKDKPFCFIDTHAGRGLYDLTGTAAARTGEAAEGIGRVRRMKGAPALPPALAAYLAIVDRRGEERYPGSSLIAAELLRPGDRLIAVERHAEEAEALADALAPFRNAKAVCADGYARLKTLVPPQERRGAVLIDPPYEAPDEFARAAQSLATARNRFASGIYLLWYPIKSLAASEAFLGEVMSHGAHEALRIVVDVGHEARDGKEQLSSAGLLVVNPPYGFAEEMRAVAAILAPKLGRTTPARITIETLGAGHA